MYAFTRRPEIHSGEEHFCIERYVRPHAVAPRAISPAETLFVFPFDHHELAASTAVKEISEALKNLDLDTMLFLRNIDQLLVTGEGVVDAVLERTVSPRSDRSDHVTLTQTTNEVERHEWYVWNRDVIGQSRDGLRVQIAFSAAADGGRIDVLTESPLVVFFPTEKETYLGFLAQAPYRTTPARDNIPHHDEWNQMLVGETAQPVRTALIDLRREGLLDVDALRTMPIDPSRFQPDTMLRPIYDAVVEAFRDESLIPTADGGHGRAGELNLARGGGLRDLVDGEQAAALFGSDRPRRWVDQAVTLDRTPGLWRYLREVLAIEEVTPETVAGRLTAGFLKQQPDEWITQLYEFLHNNRALWAKPRGRFGTVPVVHQRDIIRLEDGSHVRPFGRDGAPLAYLPGTTATEFPTVRQAVANAPTAHSFLVDLGYVEPDVVAEVLEFVLPRYENPEASPPDDQQHHDDLDRIERALTNARGDRARHLQASLTTTRFLRARNPATGEVRWRPPAALHWSSPTNLAYLEDNPDAWVIAEEYDPWRSQLLDLGVRDMPEVSTRAPDARTGHVEVANFHGHHERGLEGFDPAASIEHLEFALAHPLPTRSLVVWNELLSPNRHLVAGTVERSGRQNFVDPQRTERRSTLGEIAASHAWLPSRDGDWVRPDEIALDDLPADYKRDEIVARALGMSLPIVEEMSRQTGVPASMLKSLQDPDIRADFAEYLRRREPPGGTPGGEGDDNVEASSEAPPQIDFGEALAQVLDRPKSTRDELPDAPGDGAVSNPELRRERLREAMADDKSAEPQTTERFRPVPRRVWDSKDSATRHFVEQQYGGHCQICDDTFTTRRGAPYFEALYLVSRTNARWIDRPGNVLCLCATCCAKLQHGPVEADTLIDQIVAWRTEHEGGAGSALHLRVCGEDVQLQFTERHLLDLQEMVTNR